MAGPFELSIDTLTFDRRWRTVPPGQRLAISPDGRTLRCDVADHVFQGIHEAIPPLGQAVDELREAIDLRLVSLAQHGLVASEFSGGIDSSIVRARCLAAHRLTLQRRSDLPFSILGIRARERDAGCSFDARARRSHYSRSRLPPIF